MEIPQEVLNAGYEAVQTYKKALPHGEKWATMCALQIAPGTKGSDRAFMEGRMNGQQFDGMNKNTAQWMIREAKAAGISVSGKYYCGGLADKRRWQDPEAWVSSNDDVLRVAKKRRLSVSGTVNYDPGAAPPKRTLISESIVRDEVARELRKNPKARVGEVRDKVIEKHAYRAKGRT